MFEYYKMHGLGNHFIFFDEIQQNFSKLKKPGIIKALCDVRHGLGADGIVFIMDPQNPKYQCRMQMFNVDGTEAEMCGNAIRGVAHRFKSRNLGVEPILIETKSGVKEVRSLECRKGICFYKVDMGQASFDLVSTGDLVAKKDYKTLKWQDQEFNPVYVHVGNPHAVLFLTEKLSEDSMISLGAWLETHPNFPRRINVEFVEVRSKNEIDVHVWERGCGMTSACGTGATASAMAGIRNGKLESPVTVHMPGGDLVISCDTKGKLFMSGPIQEVAEGRLAPSFVDWLFSQN